MAEKIRPKVAQAFNLFSKKLSRSTQLLDSADIDFQREDDLLQKKVYEKDKDYQRSIVAAYSKYMNPFRVLGKNSKEAAEIYEDEQNLLKAYNLFKAIKGINEEIGDGSTFVKVKEINSPLTEKLQYISGGNFIYLQCWLMFEQRITDYVPYLEEVEDRLETFYRLEFSPRRCYEFNWQEKEVIGAIREAFHQR